MSKTLKEIAQQLSTPKTAKKTVPEKTKEVVEAKPVPKVQLIYAFNGMGKTRLSREFKQHIAGKNDSNEANIDAGQSELSRHKILYYNAFTEDLFYWVNDSADDAEPRLIIQPNTFIDWILRDRGQDGNIIANFKSFTDDKLTPKFIEDQKPRIQNGKRVLVKTYPEVTFSFARGDTQNENVKISRGEERSFVWSVFYTLLQEVVTILDESDINKRDDDIFDELEYVFIDDPISSLDDNHLIELAVNLANLIKRSKSSLKFVITTHNPLFYNILHNEFRNKYYEPQPDGSKKLIYKPDRDSKKYRLSKNADGLNDLIEQKNDSPFSYHLFLLSEIKKAVDTQQIKKYHFNFLRNILEKTATFLGYTDWQDILLKINGGISDPFANRIINLFSHSAHSGEEIVEPEEKDKEKLGEIVQSLINKYGFLPSVAANGDAHAQ